MPVKKWWEVDPPATAPKKAPTKKATTTGPTPPWLKGKEAKAAAPKLPPSPVPKLLPAASKVARIPRQSLTPWAPGKYGAGAWPTPWAPGTIPEFEAEPTWTPTQAPQQPLLQTPVTQEQIDRMLAQQTKKSLGEEILPPFETKTPPIPKWLPPWMRAGLAASYGVLSATQKPTAEALQWKWWELQESARDIAAKFHMPEQYQPRSLAEFQREVGMGAEPAKVEDPDLWRTTLAALGGESPFALGRAGTMTPDQAQAYAKAISKFTPFAWEQLGRTKSGELAAGVVGAGFQGLQEGADIVEREKGGLIWGPGSTKYGDIPLADRYQLARIAHTPTYAEAWKQVQKGALSLALSSDMPNTWQTHLENRLNVLKSRKEPEWAPMLERIRKGESGYQVATSEFKLLPEMIGWMVEDPLNLFDVLDYARKGVRVADIMRAERVMSKAPDAKSQQAVAELQRLLVALRTAETEARELGTAVDLAKLDPADGEQLKRMLTYITDLTPNAKADRDASQVFIVLSGPLGETRGVNAAEEVLARWMGDPAEALALLTPPELGATVGSPAGMKARLVMNDVKDYIGQSLQGWRRKEMAALAQGLPSPWNPERFLLELVGHVEQRLVRAYGGKPELNAWLRMARAYKGMMSEIYLNPLFSPSYSIRQVLSEVTTLLFDGVNPFSSRATLRKNMERIGIADRRLVTRGELTGSHIPTKSMFPEWTGPLRGASQRGLEFARRGDVGPEKLFSIPFGEEARYDRAYMSWWGRFLEKNWRSRLKLFREQLAAAVGDPEIADAMIAAVARGWNPKEQRGALVKLMTARTPGQRVELSRYIDPVLLDSVEPEMLAQLERALGDLPENATVDDAARVFDDWRRRVREDAAQRLADWQVAARRRVATDADEAEVVSAEAETLRNMANQSGDPALVEEAEQVAGQLDEAARQMQAERQAAVEVARAGGADSDSLEILMAANRDVERMRDQVRGVMDRVMGKTRRAYQRDPRVGQKVWPPAFRKAVEEYRAAATARIERFQLARTQMEELARGRPLEEILGKTHQELAEERLRQLIDVPEAAFPERYAPGSVMDARENELFDRFRKAQRTILDRATQRAQRAAFGVPDVFHGRALDILDSASRNVESLAAVTAGKITRARNKMLAEIAALADRGGRNTGLRIKLVQEEYLAFRNDTWRLFYADAEQVWEWAESSLRLHGLSGTDANLADVLTRSHETWTEADVARVVDATNQVETERQAEHAAENLEDVLPGIVQAKAAVTRAEVETVFREAFGQNADAMLALTDARAQRWASLTGRQAEEWYGWALSDIGRGEWAEEAGLVQGTVEQAAKRRWYYSQLERTIEQKMPNRASPQQIAGIVKGAVKPDELEWTGFNAWLGKQKGPVTKQDVLDYLMENQVEVREVAYPDVQALGGTWVQRTDRSWSRTNNYGREDAWVFAANDGLFEARGRFDERPARFSTLEEAQASAGASSDSTLGRAEGSTRYATYTLPGGENYRELVLTLPTETTRAGQEAGRFHDAMRAKYGTPDYMPYLDDAEKAEFNRYMAADRRGTPEGGYTSGHWPGIENPLAHVRFNERIDAEGKRVLFIEEIQSDWHQAGREKGYWTDRFNAPAGAVPDAPFSKTWPDLTLKRTLDWAAENGFDRVAWTTGAQQADRYNLGNLVDQLRYTETHDLIGLRGRERVFNQPVSISRLPEYIGKDAAAKLMASPYDQELRAQVIRGDDLRIGGKGMGAFYDQMLPQAAERLTKKWGGKVGTTEIVTQARHAPFAVYDENANRRLINYHNSKSEAEKWIVEHPYPLSRYVVGPAPQGQKAVHSIDVTPQMREAIKAEGFPLFQAQAAKAPPLGATRFTDEGQAIVRFFQGANISTGSHEMAHVFLQDLYRLVADMGIEGLGEDLRLAERWMGLEAGEYGTLVQKVAQGLADEGELARWTAAHEQFARGFERYLAEGIAPSSELSRLFEQFKRWLLDLYRSITGSAIDVNVSPEMRGVFDRLLAEDNLPRQVIAQRPAGKRTKAWIIPSRKYEFEYKIVDLDDLVASHLDNLDENPRFPQELQPRKRDREASRAQIDEIVRTFDNDEIAGQTFSLEAGSPIIGPDGLVEGGNGRVLALRRLRTDRPDAFALYGQYLVDNADAYGLRPDQVREVTAPVLVRQRVSDVPSRVLFVQEVNGRRGMSMSTAETAVADAERITDVMISALNVGDTETVDQALTLTRNPRFIRSFIDKLQETERASVMGEGGELSAAGKARIRAAMLARAYTGGAGRQMVTALTESTDSVIKYVEAAIVASLPHITKSEELVRTGQRGKGLTITEDVAAAANMLAKLREKHLTIEEYWRTIPGLEPEALPEVQQALLVFMEKNSRSGKPLRDLLRKYAELVEQSPVMGQPTMFGAVPEPDKAALLRKAHAEITPGPAPEEGAATLFQRGQKPWQAGMFEQGEDSPLFSGAAQKWQEPTFAPPDTSYKQLGLPGTEEEITAAGLRFKQAAQNGMRVTTPDGPGMLTTVGDNHSLVMLDEKRRIRQYLNRELELAAAEALPPAAAADPWTQGTLFQKAKRSSLWQAEDPAANAAHLVAMEAEGFADRPDLESLTRAAEEASLRAIDQMQAGVAASWGNNRSRPVLDGAQQAAVVQWYEKNALPAWWDTRAAGMQFAKTKADEALMDYNQMRGFDQMLSHAVPYHYWYTRSAGNWAKRFMRRPGLLAHWMRYRDAMRQANENAGKRQRFGQSISVPFPWLPDWAGNYLYVDPTLSVFPFAQMMEGFDDPAEGRKGLAQVWATMQKYGVRPYHFLELPFQTGAAARMARGLGLTEEKAEEVAGPETRGAFPLMLTQTRQFQLGTALAREIAPGLAKWIPPGGIVGGLDALVRQGFNLPRGDIWDPYRVSRMLANQAADEGDVMTARQALDAQALLEADKDQRGEVWKQGSPLAQEVAQRYNWTANRLELAQRTLSEAIQRAALETGMRTVGRTTGISVAIEPAGEKKQVELQRQARGLTWSPENPEGSYAAYRQFKALNPAIYPRITQYGAVPGEETQAMPPGDRANWLAASRAKERTNKEYTAKIDALLRARPWDTEGAARLDEIRFAELERITAMYPMPGAGGFEGIPTVLEGMRPEEQGNALAEEEARRWTVSKPLPDMYTKDDETDWDAYFLALGKWRDRLPVTSAELQDAQRRGGKYAQLTLPQVVDAYGQRYDTPAAAAAAVYKKMYVDAAWDQYGVMLNTPHVNAQGKQVKGYSAKEAKAIALGQVRAMDATALIPEILRLYPASGWTAQQLERELKGVRFPPMLEWYKPKQ